MDGKSKKQEVFDEFGSLISGVENTYNVSEETGQLDNHFPVIDPETGVVTNKLLGVHYDVINDFRESYNKTTISGANINVAGFPVAFPPYFLVIPTAFPNGQVNKTRLRSTTTTKVVHKTGVLMQKKAYDLGSTVYTRNKAWDANTVEYFKIA